MKNNSKILFVFIVFITILLAGEGLAENKFEEAKKIELLLAGIGTMENVVFIRNGKEYSSKKAAEHLRLKWRKAGKRVKTSEDFIELCASNSLISGKPYLVIDKAGNRRATGNWLRAELAAWRAHKP